MPRLRAHERELRATSTLLTSADAPRSRRARLAEQAPLVVLGLWTLLVAALLARLAVDNHYVFRDEANAIVLGRDIANDLSVALTGSLARGPERMTGLFAGVAASVSDSPSRQVELLHLWAALCQALVTVPVWLAARELRLSRWQALVPATIATAGSFAFFGVFTLNTAIGSLTAALLLWAMLRSLRRPGLVADLLVLATLALLALSRIGWAPLVVALAPAVLAAAWFGRPEGERLLIWLRRLPRRLLERHPLLAPAALVLLVVALVAGPSSLLGGEMYGGVRLQPQLDLSVLWDNTRTLGAHLAIGMAIVPFVLALPLLARGLVRPADGLEGGFAWLVLGLLVVFSYAYYFSMNEDRYFAVLVAPLALAGALAVFRRPPPLWSVAVSGVLVAALVATSYSWPVADAYSYFIAPTSRFFGDVVLGKLTQRLPGSAEQWAAIVVVVATAGALLVVAVAHSPQRLGRAGIAGAGIVLAGVLAFQLAAMDHPGRKFTQYVGMKAVTDEQLELVDRVGGGTAVRPLGVDGSVDPDLAAQLQMFEAYNSSLSLNPYRIGRGPDRIATPLDATVDWRTGRVDGAEPAALLLQVAGAASIGFEGEQLPPREPFPWAQLVRPSSPLRVSWVVRGTQPDRYPAGGTSVMVRVFPNGRGGRCLTGLVLAHPFVTGRVRYRLTGARRPLQGKLQAGAPRSIALPVSATRPTTFTLSGQARQTTGGLTHGPTLSDLAVGRCPRR